jgi:hypothetical protein
VKHKNLPLYRLSLRVELLSLHPLPIRSHFHSNPLPMMNQIAFLWVSWSVVRVSSWMHGV